MATRLICDWIFNDHLINVNLLLKVSVKEFAKIGHYLI